MAARQTVTHTRSRERRVPDGYAKCKECGGDGIVKVRGANNGRSSNTRTRSRKK